MLNGGVLTFDPIFAKSRHQCPGYTSDHHVRPSPMVSSTSRTGTSSREGHLDLKKGSSLVRGVEIGLRAVVARHERTDRYPGI